MTEFAINIAYFITEQNKSRRAELRGRSYKLIKSTVIQRSRPLLARPAIYAA